MSQVKGLSETKVEKIKDAVNKIFVRILLLTILSLMQPLALKTGSEIYNSRRRVFSITSGSKQLDSVLGGMYFYEVELFYYCCSI